MRPFFWLLLFCEWAILAYLLKLGLEWAGRRPDDQTPGWRIDRWM